MQLAELLNEITPGSFRKKTILANSGAEAVENAIQLSRKYTGRPAVICFEGGYHGRTLLTLSLTSKYGLFKSGFGPFAPEIVRLPIPHPYRTPKGMTEDQYIDFGIRQLENAFVAQVEPSAVAAIIIEPVQGEAGFIPVPPRFLRRIRELCDQHGIVMIADEVQCGIGRTGRLFAVEHYGVVPDLIMTAKSLGAGMPIAAVTGRGEIMDAAHLGGVGGTYGGSPVACAAAIEAVNMIRRPAFLAHARHLGDIMRRTLDGWKATWPFIGDVRGLGPMMVIEFVRDPESKEPAQPEEHASDRARSRGERRHRHARRPLQQLRPSAAAFDDPRRHAEGRPGCCWPGHRERCVTAGSGHLIAHAGPGLHGGLVLTQADRTMRPAPTAVGVRAGRVALVGDDQSVLSAAGPATKRVHLGGRTASPASTTPTRTSGRSAIC